LLLKKGGQTVYFGPLGENAGTLIDYFQSNGARKIEPDENVAEYMLEVIGAGATATSEFEWHEKWVQSEEAERVQEEIERIHEDGRKKPAVQGVFTW
jgi:ATP-binding cassette, subfamily G (WHITE), member 2, SNQ2